MTKLPGSYAFMPVSPLYRSCGLNKGFLNVWHLLKTGTVKSMPLKVINRDVRFSNPNLKEG
jgi:hypothetical protein